MIDLRLFEEIPCRRGSGSYKWDSAEDGTVLPMWVADMDFKTAPVVIEALRERVEHGIFGYTLVGKSYYDSLFNWFNSRHGYAIDIKNVIYTSGVVPAISAVIKALTIPGDAVIVQTPVYNCFFSSIRNNGCRIIDAPLLRKELEKGLFTYEMDFDALEKAAAEKKAKLMLLCNPHNPAGRVWTEDELIRVKDICDRHDVTVISDEIHCELTMPGYHYTPYGTVDKKAVICLSPSKAFNTAGLQIANIVAPDLETRSLIDRAININEVCDVNPFGPVALEASYSKEGFEWLEQLRAYIYENYEYLLEVFRQNLPQCHVTRLEATYLPWVDISMLGINSSKVEDEMLKESKVWINSGEMYGQDGYIRINIACPRRLLEQGLERIILWLKRHLD